MVPQDDSPQVSLNPAFEDHSPEFDQKHTLAKVVALLDSMTVEDLPDAKSCFIGSAIPPITLLDYVERLVKYTNQWAEDTVGPNSTGVRCILIAAEYIRRSKVRLTVRSVHRYVMAAMLLAVKFTEDFAISNQFWGDVGGCKLEDVNRMEIAFCKDLEWNMCVDEALVLSSQVRYASPSF